MSTNAAPAVHFPAGGGAGLSVAWVFVAMLVPAVLLLWWVQAPVTGWRAALGLALGVMALSGLSLSGRQLARAAEIRWDGQHWLLWRDAPHADANAGPMPGRPVVSLAGPGFLLLRWQPLASGQPRGPAQWLWVRQAARPAAWGDLRRAVYSRATPV